MFDDGSDNRHLSSAILVLIHIGLKDFRQLLLQREFLMGALLFAACHTNKNREAYSLDQPHVYGSNIYDFV